MPSRKGHTDQTMSTYLVIEISQKPWIMHEKNDKTFLANNNMKCSHDGKFVLYRDIKNTANVQILDK